MSATAHPAPDNTFELMLDDLAESVMNLHADIETDEPPEILKASARRIVVQADAVKGVLSALQASVLELVAEFPGE